jgi:riboflavin biosynthesis pyrimidine reductase
LVSTDGLPGSHLDELVVTVAPTFLGRGPGLADGDFTLRRFRLVGVEHREGKDGVTLRYERNRALD